MPTPPIPDDTLQTRVAAYLANDRNQVATAKALGIARQTLQHSLARAAERGLLGTAPVLEGYVIKSVSSKADDGAWVKQVKEAGPTYEPTPGLAIKGKTTWTNAEGRITQQVTMERAGAEAQADAMRAVVAALMDDLPRAAPVPMPSRVLRKDLLNQFTVTDLHFGSLSWREETGADYDLDIAERLLVDWFAAAIELSPPAATAVLAQLGDLLHYDGFESKTPSSGHILDADSRLTKVIRVVIRVLRRVVRMLLEKHEHVHIIMADANHDPASEAWLREMFAAFFEDDPRVTVDSSASTYYAYEHGDTSLFYHHGHKRRVGDVDSVFAGRFRHLYGRTKKSYGHIGHLHSDELKSTNLMKIERHETLAAPDAYASNGGWLSGRSAKVITYSSKFGEVSRLVLTPEMVAGWSDKPVAANDNEVKMEKVA